MHPECKEQDDDNEATWKWRRTEKTSSYPT